MRILEPEDYGKEDMTNEPEQKTPESENDPKTQEKPARRKNPKMGAAGMADEVADVAASVAADSVKTEKRYQISAVISASERKRGGGEIRCAFKRNRYEAAADTGKLWGKCYHYQCKLWSVGYKI